MRFLKAMFLGVMATLSAHSITYADTIGALKQTPASMWEVGLTRLNMKINQLEYNNVLFLSYLHNVGFIEKEPDHRFIAYLSMLYPKPEGLTQNKTDSRKILLLIDTIEDKSVKTSGLSRQRATQLGQVYIKGAKAVFGYVENDDASITDTTSETIGAWFSSSDTSYEQRKKIANDIGLAMFFRVRINDVANTGMLFCESDGIREKISCKTLDGYLKKE